MARPDRLLRNQIRSRYLVTLESGEAFDGLLLDADDRNLILGDVESVSSNGDRLKVDGQLWIPRVKVAYMQLPRT